MTEFLTYQGKTAVILAVFYMFYRLLLSKDTFHRFNRIILLGTAALSFVLPLCVITIHEVVTIPAVQQAPQVLESATNGTVAAVAEVSEPIWQYVLCVIFGLGAFGVVVMTIISIAKVIGIIAGGERRTLESGEILVITAAETPPFSWMKYIVLSREDYESGYSQILTHEKAHIALRHSWDILFVDMITALQWFNPAMWMFKADLRAIHEFEADDVVLRSGADVKEYQYLLIRKAVSKSGYSVANSFNHSTLKARITMMLNQKSSRKSAWKALYLLPLVGISLAATAETKVDYQYEDQQPDAVVDTLKGKGNENWHKVGSGEPTSFRKKNLHDGKIITDLENNMITVIFYNVDGRECKTQFVGINPNENIYIHNGVYANEEIFDKVAAEEPEAVIMVGHLKNDKKICVVVTPSEVYVTGKVILREEKEDDSIKVKALDTEGKEVPVDPSKILFVVDGKPKPEGYSMNQIDPDTLETHSIYVQNTLDIKVIQISGKSQDGVQIVGAYSANPADDQYLEKQEEKVKAILDNAGARPDGKPIYIIDGQVQGDDFDIDCLNPDFIRNIKVWVPENAEKEFGEKGRNGVVAITSKVPMTIDSTADGSVKVQSIAADGSMESSDVLQPLYVVDGQVMPQYFSLKTVKPEDIESISVLKDGEQTEVYGERAKDGVIYITLKKKESE